VRSLALLPSRKPVVPACLRGRGQSGVWRRKRYCRVSKREASWDQSAKFKRFQLFTSKGGLIHPRTFKPQSRENWPKNSSTFGEKYHQNPHKWLQDRTRDFPRRAFRGYLRRGRNGRAEKPGASPGQLRWSSSHTAHDSWKCGRSTFSICVEDTL